MITHVGGCHCGRVSFEVDAPADIKADALTTYTFNTGIAQHFFCRHCGIKSFYVPRSHPDGISVNVNCLAPGTIASTEVTPFDGANWEQNIDKLSPISD